MKLTGHSKLHVVVEEGGVSVMTLSELALAFRGGLEMSKLTIFSESKEAQEYSAQILWLARGTKVLQSLEGKELHDLVVKLEKGIIKYKV